MPQILKRNAKVWERGRSFTDLMEYVPTNCDVSDGENPYDIKLKKRVDPPCELSRDEHQIALQREQFENVQLAMTRTLDAREKFVTAVAKYGVDSEAIKHAITNPAATAAPAPVTPSILLGTPQRGWVGEAISPSFQVEGSTGIYYEWLPDATHRLYDNEIVKGEEPKEIEASAAQFTFTLHEYALANRIYKKDLQNSHTALRMLAKAPQFLANAMQLAREARVLNVALSPLVGFVAAAGAWTLAGGGLVIDEIIAAMVAIYNRTQMFPTDIMIPRQIAMTMIRTANWLATFNAGSDAGWNGVWKLQTGLENLGLRVHISDVCALTTDQGTASDPRLFANIVGRQVLVWARDDMPVENSRTFMASPYTVMGEVVSGEFDREKKTRSMYWQEYEETTELLIDAFCGCRITGV